MSSLSLFLHNIQERQVCEDWLPSVPPFSHIDALLQAQRLRGKYTNAGVYHPSDTKTDTNKKEDKINSVCTSPTKSQKNPNWSSYFHNILHKLKFNLLNTSFSSRPPMFSVIFVDFYLVVQSLELTFYLWKLLSNVHNHIINSVSSHITPDYDPSTYLSIILKKQKQIPLNSS